MTLHATNLRIDTPSGRPLFRRLSLEMAREQAAIVGRNGVGKSTLLRVLAGVSDPDGGSVRRGRVVFTPQVVDGHGSPGERRRLALQRAFGSRADLLLLDEPTQDLDAAGRTWLLGAIRRWTGGLLVVSHDRELLAAFDQFLVLRESGGLAVRGGLDVLDDTLAEHADSARRRYLQAVADAESAARRGFQVQQRRRRKKAVGRLHELDRCQSRARLNTRRGAAQVSQARVNRREAAALARRTDWARAARRALAVEGAAELSLSASPPREPHALHGEGLGVQGLFEGVDLSLGRARVAVVGPNGSGKSTLLSVLVGDRQPDAGWSRCDPVRVGHIAQGAANWSVDTSLLAHLNVKDPVPWLEAHRFPVALADRPLASLSPGERTLAALLALSARSVEVLVLDEPTASLDLHTKTLLTGAIAGWAGGLVVASHDADWLSRIGMSSTIELG